MNIKKTISILNQSVKTLIAVISLTVSVAALLLVSLPAHSQDVEQVRWKSEAHVKSLYGEPNSIQGPIGTHATYILWKYDGFTVAFANNRAFHLFNKDSLVTTIELDENR